MGANNSKEAKKEDGGKRYGQPVPVKNEDYSKELPREKLPKNLQNIVDKEDTLWDEISEGRTTDTTDSSLRYAAYARRLRTVLVSAQRYVAYTSDIGESFRPIASPLVVRTAYGISWAYLTGDVGYEGYKAYLRQHPSANSASAAPNAVPKAVQVPAIEDWRSVVVQRAVFQSLASMALPAFTIHSIVRYSGQAMKNVKNTRVRAWGPIGLGLAAVPFLPYLFDKPVENAVEKSFHTIYKSIGGPEAVGDTSSTGREDRLAEVLKHKKKEKIKEKEL